MDAEQLLTVKEVAAQYRVNPKTVRRWANSGKLPTIRTPGGSYRFRIPDMDRVFAAQHDPARNAQDIHNPVHSDMRG